MELIKISRIRYFLLLLILAISSCNSKDLRTPEQPYYTVTNKEARQLAIERVKNFSRNLSVTIKLNETIFTSQTIDITIEIKNTSNHSIVLRAPRSTGIASTYIFASSFNDVNIFLADKNGDLIKSVLPSSQFALDPRMHERDHIIQPYLWHQQKDFVILQPNEVYSYLYSDKAVYMIPENETSYQLIPDSEYLIYAVYYNEYIGYQAVDDKNIENFNFLFEENTPIYDLNAWVGEVTSNEINISIK